MDRTKRITGSLAALTILAAGVAEAKPLGAGVFFGVGGGSSTYDQDKSDYDFISRDAFSDAGLPIISLQSELDDSDSGWAGTGPAAHWWSPSASGSPYGKTAPPPGRFMSR